MKVCYQKSLVPFKNCAIVAGIFAIIQCIIWICLSIFIIEYRTRKLDYENGNEHWSYFYLTYLRTRSERPIVLTLMYLELILAVLWLILSITLIKVVLGAKNTCTYAKSAKVVYILWSLIGFLICLADLVSVCKLILDNVIFLSRRPIECTTPTTPTTTPLTTTTTTARPIKWCECGCGCTNSYNPNKTSTDTTTTTTTTTPTTLSTSEFTIPTTPRKFEGYVILPVYLLVLLIQSRCIIIWIFNLASCAILFSAAFVHIEFDFCGRCSECKDPLSAMCDKRCGKRACRCGKPTKICYKPKVCYKPSYCCEPNLVCYPTSCEPYTNCNGRGRIRWQPGRLPCCIL